MVVEFIVATCAGFRMVTDGDRSATGRDAGRSVAIDNHILNS